MDEQTEMVMIEVLNELESTVARYGFFPSPGRRIRSLCRNQPAVLGNG